MAVPTSEAIRWLVPPCRRTNRRCCSPDFGRAFLRLPRPVWTFLSAISRRSAFSGSLGAAWVFKPTTSITRAATSSNSTISTSPTTPRLGHCERVLVGRVVQLPRPGNGAHQTPEPALAGLGDVYAVVLLGWASRAEVRAGPSNAGHTTRPGCRGAIWIRDD